MKSPENMTPEELDDLEKQIKELRKKKGDKLYLVKRLGLVGYDETEGYVIRASSARQARAIAEEECHDKLWLDSNRSTCERLRESGEAGVILSAFNAG